MPPGVLRHVKTAAGKPLVEGKKVTGFTDGEEADVGLTKVVVQQIALESGRLGTKRANRRCKFTQDTVAGTSNS